MTRNKLISIIFIFFGGVCAWFILGQANWIRSHDTAFSVHKSVQELWGAPIVQHAPTMSVKVPGSDRLRYLTPSRNNLRVNINLEQRKKGLLWYPTYIVEFHGEYELTNSSNVAQNIRVDFSLPSTTATYENLKLEVDGQLLPLDIVDGRGFARMLPLGPGATAAVKVQYRTRGMDSWSYVFDSNSAQVRGLEARLQTNFKDIDYSEGALSPMNSEPTPQGLDINWQADELITQQNLSIELPRKLNPGPLAARMSFFAPICLLFFFVLISAVCIKKKISIHPMHYLFVNAGFLAFHLLFAYSIDVINVHLSFVISSLVSIALVVGYLARALGPTFPWKIAALGQIIYLVLFSYSFFIEGLTGLTVTLVSIATLAVLMTMTHNTDWNTVFTGSGKEKQKKACKDGEHSVIGETQ